MEQQQTSKFFIQGIQQDTAYQLSSPNFLFDALNVRINAVDNNSLLSITNEKGNTKVLEIKDEENSITILNYCLFTDYFILFGEYDSTDYIIKVYKEGNSYTYKTLLKGNYNFNTDITYWNSIGFTENEKLDKVYWIDGKNQPRIFKIIHDNENSTDYKYSLDFLPTIINKGDNNLPNVQITKANGNGRFASGVLQYYITYSNTYLQESNIWYVSPLFYIGMGNKAASPETICNAAFTFNITNLNNSFDYINIYGVLRSSKDAVPNVYKISNIPIKDNLTFIDNGSLGESTDIGTLFALQSSGFIPKAMAVKDNTLFFSNYSLINELSEAEETIINNNIQKNGVLSVVESDFIEDEFTIALPEKDTDIRTFKHDEWYRVGLQFMDYLGTPSKIFYIKDIKIDAQHDLGIKDRKELLKRSLQFKGYAIPEAVKDKYCYARLVMVQRDAYPVRNISQGVICPTIFELHNRCNNTPFAMSSWNFRTLDIRLDDPDDINKYPISYGGLPLAANSNTLYGEIQNQTKVKVENTDNLFWTKEATNTGSNYFIQLTLYQNPLQNAAENILNIYYTLKIGRSTKEAITKITDCEKIYSKGYDTYLSSIYSTALGKGYDVKTWDGFKAYILNTISEYLRNSKGRAVVYKGCEDTLNGLDNPFNKMIADSSLAYIHALPTNHDSSSFYKVSSTYTENPENSSDLAASRDFTYYVDDTILTFHAIDVEENQNLLDKNNEVKFKIVGECSLDYSRFDYLINPKTGPKAAEDGKSGVQKFRLQKDTKKWGAYNAPLWVDDKKIPLFLWHRYNTLGNQTTTQTTDGIWYGDYTRKVFANTHFFSKTYYICSPITAYDTEQSYVSSHYFLNNHPSSVRVFNTDQVQSYVLETPSDSYVYDKLNYQGNVKELSTDSFSSLYFDSDTLDDLGSGNQEIVPTVSIKDSLLMYYKSTPHVVLSMSPIKNGDSSFDYHLPLSRIVKYSADGKTKDSLPNFIPNPDHNSQKAFYYKDGVWQLTFGNTEASMENFGYLWDKSYYKRIIELVGITPQGLGGPFYKFGLKDGESILWIAELYQDLDNIAIFGDNSKEILAKHTWIPIGTWTPINGSTINLIGYGDCFIGRYECLKTYSYTEEDKQSCIEVASFLTESTKNPCGRYDNYANLGDSSIIKANEFNKFNSVYDQQNNLFSYNIPLDINTYYPNNIIWTSVKYAGELTDSFTKVTFNGGVDVQGTYGQIQKLISFNNTLYSIQNRAIYKINYNNRIAISPSDNTPIIIGNNANVDTPILLKEGVGISSPKNITEGNEALYLYDNNHKEILAIAKDSNIVNLSKTKNMQTYFNKIDNCNSVIYDPLANDIYFQVKEEIGDKCIAFNELIGNFTSFYDYQDIQYVVPFNGEALSLTSNTVWKQRSSEEYCNFCNTLYSYYITFIANDAPDKTKIFNNINFAANLGDESIITNSTPFNYMCFNDSYQVKEPISLHNYVSKTGLINSNTESNLRKLFKQWHITIPRADNRNRFVDLWLKITLGNNSDKATIKNQITNLSVTYNII